MDPPEDFGCADAFCDARVAFIDEAHDAAFLGAVGGHDGCLGAGVHEGFDFVIVHLDVDVEHVHSPES